LLKSEPRTANGSSYQQSILPHSNEGNFNSLVAMKLPGRKARAKP
jgi:hypothetical protein